MTFDPQPESNRIKSSDVSSSGSKRLIVDGLRNISLLFGSVTVALLLGEAVIRILFPQQLVELRPDVWMPVDSLGWQHRQNLHVVINTGERPVTLLTDSEGFRVGEQGRVVADDSVLVIGDSFMAALQVPYEVSVPGLIENRLSLAVRNTAVGAWDTPHYLMMARRRLAANLYGAVLVSVFVGNDIVRARSEYFPPLAPVERSSLRVPDSFAASEWIDALARPMNDMLEERSHLFVFAKARTEALRIKLGLSAGHVPPGILRERAQGSEWDTTADMLAEIDSVARAQGSPALFVLIPERYQVDLELFRAHAVAFDLDLNAVDVDQPSRRLAAELEERGVASVDALDAFREAHANGASLYGSIDPHLSPEGHEVLFRVIAPRLEALLDTPFQ